LSGDRVGDPRATNREHGKLDGAADAGGDDARENVRRIRGADALSS